jgi:6,7-dimethyl-8-ribityllumazine synthase
VSGPDPAAETEVEDAEPEVEEAAEPPVRDSGPGEGVRGNRGVPPTTEEAAENSVAAEEADEALQEHSPGELELPDGVTVLEGEPRGGRRPVGVVVSRFNGEVTGRMLERALERLDEIGIPRELVTVMPVPGAFELPLAAMALAKTRRFACLVALGCVIRGETPHFDYVASEAASGLQLAALETGVPVAFGVLTLDRVDQAEARVGKGAEAVRSALEMADLFAHLRAAAAAH